MKSLINYIIILIGVLLIATSCARDTSTSVVILSCIDSDGFELNEAVTITVDGFSQTWMPGETLEFDIEMEVDQGYISVLASGTDFQMVSPSEYEVERSKGLELVLSFAEPVDEVLAEDLPVVPEIETPAEEEPEEPGFADVSFEVNPRGAEVTVIAADNSRETFRGSRSLHLREGSYRWQAELDGYDDATGRFTVNADRANRVTINLDEVVLDDGYLATLIDPGNATLYLRNEDTGEELTVSSVGIQVIDLYPGIYQYSIEAPGYLSENGNFRIREAMETPLERIMINQSASAIIQQAGDVETAIQAERLLNALQDQWPLEGMDQDTRHQLTNQLINVADILYRGGASSLAFDLYEMLFQEFPNHIELRMAYGSYLILNGEPEWGRQIIMPVQGTLQNLIPSARRSEVVWLSRYRVAQSFYIQFDDTPANDFDNRARYGERAMSELENVISLYQSLNLPEEFERDFVWQAEDWRDIIIRELR